MKYCSNHANCYVIMVKVGQGKISEEIINLCESPSCKDFDRDDDND